jgi:hypothetical protein
MPKAAAALDAAVEILPIAGIGPRLVALLAGTERKARVKG